MADISNKTFGTLIGIALFISIIGIFSTGTDLFKIIGFATTGTGQARVNVTPLISLNITHNLIDFGNGTVNPGLVNCTMSSDKTGDYLTCFTPTTGGDGPISGGFTVANIGNVNINVTVKATQNGSLKNGNNFWGTEGGRYLYKCSGNGTAVISTFQLVNNRTKLCQGNVESTSGSNGFTLDINITIPGNVTGFKNDTLTFTASRTCPALC